MRKSTPIISAVIPSYNRYPLLEGAIQSLLQQNFAPDSFEIIVVDNSPDQDAAERFGARYSGVANLRYIFEPVAGVSNARNKGAGLARGDIVAFIDDDAVATPDWIRQILTAFEANGNGVGCVGGRVVPRWTAPRPSWLPDELLSYLSIVDWGGAMRELGRGEWLAACNLAFDGKALAAAGGFSRVLGRIGSDLMLLSMEDLHLCKSLRANGKSVIYAPAAVVEHIIDPARLTQEWMRRRIAWQVVSDYIEDPGRMAANAAASAAQTQRRLSVSIAADDADTFLHEHDVIKDLLLGLLSGKVGLNRRGLLHALAARLRRPFESESQR